MNPSTDWIDQARRVLDALRSDAGDTGEGHSSDCRWCPICDQMAVRWRRSKAYSRSVRSRRCFGSGGISSSWTR